GGSVALDHEGNLVGELPYFRESLELFEISQPEIRSPEQGKRPAAIGPALAAGYSAGQTADARNVTGTLDYAQCITEPAIARIHEALLTGIGDYFRKSGFSKAILGMSGGIDSALV